MFNNFCKNSNSKSGFTLIEVITALFIAMVGIMSAYELVNQTIVAAKVASMQLTAAYLGKEGIEIVKNIRDSNYLVIYKNSAPGTTWDTGLTLTAGTFPIDCDDTKVCVADYEGARLYSIVSDSLEPRLSMDTANSRYFIHDMAGGNPATPDTPYSRWIRVTENGAGDMLSVSVLVEWSEHGRSHSITVQEDLYNWW